MAINVETMKDKKSILVFGCGPLQQSIINRAKRMGLYTVGIDPCEDATCRGDVDAFEVVGGQDYEGTCAVVEKYGIDAIVTAATDKPLVMMARIAAKYGFPFYSVETAQWSTDKFQMKQRFELGDVPHARGILLNSEDLKRSLRSKSLENNKDNFSDRFLIDFEADKPTQELHFPVIVKPRDNSGSRGVKLCRTKEELEQSMAEALEYSKLDSVLVEEFIEGPEYSIESLHHDGKSEVIQFTEKKTTEFPYNVELGHIQPANISDENKQKIREIVAKIGKALKFENCPSHTELKINERGIFVIETSPRLGGDYITSTLTPLSTGVNVEDELLRIALGEKISPAPQSVQYSGVRFFAFDEGNIIKHVPDANFVKTWPHVVDFSFNLKEGDSVNQITSSLNRYGHLTLIAGNRASIEDAFEKYEKAIKESVMAQ
jgi:carbamoyl-phosphate synthase large subunit